MPRSHLRTDNDIQADQSSISYAVSITCLFWSMTIESAFTYIICRLKHLTEKNKRILQCPEIHLNLCINIVIHSRERLLFDTSQRRFDFISSHPLRTQMKNTFQISAEIWDLILKTYSPVRNKRKAVVFEKYWLASGLKPKTSSYIKFNYDIWDFSQKQTYSWGYSVLKFWDGDEVSQCKTRCKIKI